MRSARSAIVAALTTGAISSTRPASAGEPAAEPPAVDFGIDSAAERGVARPEHAIVADLGLHVVGVGYQITVSPGVAIQFALDWYVPWTETEEVLDLWGVVARQRAFFYPFGGAPAGLWISPYAQYGLAVGEREGEMRSGPALAAGASVGWAIDIVDAVHLSLGGGGQYHVARIAGGGAAPGFEGFAPTVDIVVGYAF